MSADPWEILGDASLKGDARIWLESVLSRNAGTDYLRGFGSPLDITAFRARVPSCCYEDLIGHIGRIRAGYSDVLFAGRPIAFERTGGSSGGAKLIPYTAEGLSDFQFDIVPWLVHTIRTFGIRGKVYFSISPATRAPERYVGVPVGLSDAAYLGERVGALLASMSAVPPTLALIEDVDVWRRRTVEHLRATRDLELISVWSPTFLLRLLDDIPDPLCCWPQLKLVSCWASASSSQFAAELSRRMPGVPIQPKGLMSTEAVVTVPDKDGAPVAARHVFIEFLRDGRLYLERELELGCDYEAVVTTGSGLYRYRTGDRLRYSRCNRFGRSVLEFIGREGMTSDLVGEKLTERFVERCLESSLGSGFVMLVADTRRPGYVVVSEHAPGADALASLEAHLSVNPQYAYARKLEQLAPLRVLTHPQPFAAVERILVERGARLSDVKPLALRTESFWVPYFEAAA